MTTTSVPTARRRLVAGAALALTVVMAAGCSSSSDQKSNAKHVKRAAATEHVDDAKKTPSTTAAPAASTTTSAPAAPECTDAAAQAAMSGVTVTGVQCADGYAAGSLTDNASGVTGGFMLQAVDGHWQQMGGDALTALCTTDLPNVLEQGCYDD